MRPIPKFPGAVLAALLVWAAIVIGLALVGRQLCGHPLLAASSQSTPPAAPDPADNKSGESGGWHHFGPGPNAPVAGPHPSDSGSRMGEGGSVPPYSHQIPTWRNLGSNHVQGVEQQMYLLVNRDRADPANNPETNGRALPLRWSDRLAAVARAHSLDMLNEGYFSHQDRQGGSVATRIEAAGMKWQAVGENIAIYCSVARAEASFMSEPRFGKNHRANILSPEFTEIGIGVVQAPNGSLYITQDFYACPAPTAAR